jgi:hypothetical protein
MGSICMKSSVVSIITCGVLEMIQFVVYDESNTDWREDVLIFEELVFEQVIPDVWYPLGGKRKSLIRIQRPSALVKEAVMEVIEAIYGVEIYENRKEP